MAVKPRVFNRVYFLMTFVVTLTVLALVALFGRHPNLGTTGSSTLELLAEGKLSDPAGLYLGGTPLTKNCLEVLERDIIRPRLENYRVVHTDAIQDRRDVGSATVTLAGPAGDRKSLSVNTYLTPGSYHIDLDKTLYQVWAIGSSLSLENSDGKRVAAALAASIEQDSPKLESCGIPGLIVHDRYRPWSELLSELRSVNEKPTNPNAG